MTSIPKIAITMGDPSGVGPEICLKLLEELLQNLDTDSGNRCIPILLGDIDVLKKVAQKCGLQVPNSVVGVAEPDLAKTINSTTKPLVIDFATPEIGTIEPGKLSPVSGSAAYRYIEKAIELQLAGSIDAVVTAPINKRALHMAGHHYPGHTEIFTEQSGASRSCMMQYSTEVTCSFVTTHVGYHEVPKLLTQERIVEVMKLSLSLIHI